jgi:hypothetical protein
MKTHELIKNHEGLIFFYPFSGTHFKITEELKNLAKHFNQKCLFVYCSFGGNIDDYEQMENKNKPIVRGLYTDVHFIENKLGLDKIEISSSQKLSDENFDARFFTFGDTGLIFVKSEAFYFMDHLTNKGIEMNSMNLILSYAQGFDEVLKNLTLQFIHPQAIEGNVHEPKTIILNKHYLKDVEELLSNLEGYKWKKVFQETNSNEEYSILFEKGENYLSYITSFM